MASIINPIDKKAQPETKDLMYDGLTVKQSWYKKVVAEEAKVFESGKPFCRRCAHQDVQLQQTIMQSKGRGTSSDPDNCKVEINLGDYSKASRFKLLGVKKSLRYDPATRRQVDVGDKYEDWQCKERGCKLSILVEAPEGKN